MLILVLVRVGVAVGDIASYWSEGSQVANLSLLLERSPNCDERETPAS